MRYPMTFLSLAKNPLILAFLPCLLVNVALQYFKIIIFSLYNDCFNPCLINVAPQLKNLTVAATVSIISSLSPAHWPHRPLIRKYK